MLDAVCAGAGGRGGIRAYLQSRSDTIRCIVENITDSTNTDLMEEVCAVIRICK